MFLLRSSSSLYGIANSFVLGLLTTPSIVGYYASAEKIAKSISGLLLPIRESLYPRLSHLVSRSPEETRRLTRLGVILMGGGGLFLGLLTCFAAPQIIHILMGPGFEPSIRVLQVLAALPFVIALTDSVGLQHLLPHGKESVVNPVMLLGGVFNLIAAFIFAPRFEALGMAWCVVGAESLVCLTLMAIVMKSHQSPTAKVVDSPSEDIPAGPLAEAADV
jgi:PST family polysaccharide transporter